MNADEAGSDFLRALPPTYEDRVVAWVDVLGWSELVRASANATAALLPVADAAELIASTLRRLSDPNDIWKGVKAALGFPPVRVTCSHFSDTYVISALATTGGYLEVTCAAARLCCALLNIGLLTRGAVVRGQLRHQDNGVLYGPAVLEAHDIEQRVATYPRLIVTDAAAQLADKGMPMLWEDGDGLLYLDILFAGISGRRDARIQQLAALEKKCELALSEYANNLNVRAKYEWQLRYIKATKEELEADAAAAAVDALPPSENT